MRSCVGLAISGETESARLVTKGNLMTDNEIVRVKSHGAVTLITINHPQRMNVLDSNVRTKLISAFVEFEDDCSQLCAVVTGSDRVFAAGVDINEMAPQGFAEMYRANHFDALERAGAIRKPWIAAVAGYALGGGCELAMMADFIIAADTALFGQPEIKLGIAPGMGGSQRLTRAVGKAKAMEMCLTGRTMCAAEAERSGLVSRVVPAAKLIEDALETAATIARMPPLATMANKEMVDAAFETGLAQGMLFERRLFHGLCATDDKRTGMRAFKEKQEATWSGA